MLNLYSADKLKMPVEYNVCTTSSSTLSDSSSVKGNKICKNLASHKKSRKSYYICLGALARMVQTQIQTKYAPSNRLYLIASKYIEDFHRWTYRYKYKELFLNDFLRSLIASIALFAVGVKLTNELVAWKVT